MPQNDIQLSPSLRYGTEQNPLRKVHDNRAKLIEGHKKNLKTINQMIFIRDIVVRDANRSSPFRHSFADIESLVEHIGFLFSIVNGTIFYNFL